METNKLVRSFNLDTQSGPREIKIVLAKALRAVKEPVNVLDASGQPQLDAHGNIVRKEVEVYPLTVQIDRNGWKLADYIQVYGGEANVLSVLDADFRMAGNKCTRAATTEKEGLDEEIAAKALEKWLRDDAGASIKDMTEALEAIEKELAGFEPKLQPVFNGDINPATGMEYTVKDVLSDEERTALRVLKVQKTSLVADIESRRRKPKAA
jgi:hypothetical protein